MNPKIASAFGLLAIIIALGVIFKPWAAPQPEPESEGIHFHAGFQVYVDNELQDFSDLKYMNVEPCNDHEEEIDEGPEHEQMEKAHLHDNIGDVVHVHREGATWRDLFQNMEYDIDESHLVLYVDGQLVDAEHPLDEPITAYESALFLVGDNDNLESKLAGAVTKEHVEDAEQRSENCGV